jgi:flagellar basal-body rod protein FlgC
MLNRLFGAIDTSASGLTAQRLRMDTIADNIANADSTRTPEGGPFKKELLVFAAKSDIEMRRFPFLPMKIKTQLQSAGDGVKVVAQLKDQSAPRLKYETSHPDANSDGYVAYPNVDVVKEMVDMISATRSYEANVTSINAQKTMFAKALELGK